MVSDSWFLSDPNTTHRDCPKLVHRTGVVESTAGHANTPARLLTGFCTELN
jgi:hypothetical protein